MKTMKKVAALALGLLLAMSMGAWAAELSVSEGVDWTFENGGKGWDARNPWDPQLGVVVNEAQYINFSYNENEDNVHGGEKALRLSNDGEKGYGSSSVSLTLHRSLVQQNRSLTLEGFVKVEDLGTDSTVNINWYFGGGWKHSVSVASFSAEEDWEKFVFAPYWWDGDTYDYSYLSLTLNGTGTVYFDDIFCGWTDNICANGDFEAGAISAVPTGWTHTRTGTNFTVAWGTDAMVEQGVDGNRYLHLKNTSTTSSKNHYMYMAVNEVKGAKYTCTARFKTTEDNANFPGIQFGTVKNDGWHDDRVPFVWEKISDDGDGWGTYRGTCIIPENAPDLSFFIPDPGTWGREAWYDDITLSIDSTPVITKAEDGTVTATSHVVALEERPATLFIGAYTKSANGDLCLAKLSSISTDSLSAGETRKLEKSVTLPDGGKEYIVKAFLWDGISTLNAQTIAVTE